MKRKLLLLNVVLLALLAYAGWQVRRSYVAAKAREAAELNRRAKSAAPPPFTPAPTAPPVSPGGYAAIAQQMLFDKSRNPNVIVEVPVPPPPPPKPMPPLPLYHGQLNIGDGPTVILSENANAAHQALRLGEQIGQFTLVDVNSEEITFEWDGNTIKRKLDTLIDRSEQAQAIAAAQTARTELPPPPVPVAKTPTGPGGEMGGGFRACDVNDSLPAGTVQNGFRKVLTPSPFGSSCRWEPVTR